ncbi:CAP domain-containing protein [Mycobacterium sp. 1274761.0]|uniref:CAP domain-containing protein n=1 Tax=Mycobacterium sp. 1274761.0 TaxID=1834077 RepID=UPI001E651E95|nr:CAP domain-containing protein [Mycobacterium sp. 1274761.0]
MNSHGKSSAFVRAYLAVATVLGSAFAPVLAHADIDNGSDLLNQINATRAANGCGPVAPNPELTASATRHATDMLHNGVREHVGSDGSTVVQRATDAGYTPYAAIGEVVFWSTGYGNDPANAVNWWMNSPGHRAIITNCSLTEAGFSEVSSGDRTTAAGDFGTKR